jgi:hypothetical protein
MGESAAVLRKPRILEVPLFASFCLGFYKSLKACVQPAMQFLFKLLH